MDLQAIEEYYDAAPRPLAAAEEIGPFVLFVHNDADGWPYYARPRLACDGSVTVEDVRTVLRRQRDLGLPQSFEWVHETSPRLLDVIRESGLKVALCPLLALPRGGAATLPEPPDGVRLEVLDGASARLADAVAAVGAAFAGSDSWRSGDAGPLPSLIDDGITVTAGAFDAAGAIGGGSHSPRGTATELTGIGVIPRARRQGVGAAITALLTRDAIERGMTTILLSAQDDDVARVYERVGFVRVGTACIATARP